MAKTLREFLQERGIPSSTAPSSPTITAEPSGISAKIEGASKKVLTTAAKPLRWAGKQLMKPVSSVAVTTEQVGKALGKGDVGELIKIPKKVSDILVGETERSFSDIWRDNLPQHPTAATIIGTIIDITADPLNFTGGGIAKGVKAVGMMTKKIPGVPATLGFLKRMFSTSTGNKNADLFIQQMKDLGNYREAEVIKRSRDIIKNQVSKLKPAEFLEVAERLERGVKSKNPLVNNLADQLSKTYADWLKAEQTVGVKVKGVQSIGYAPRIPRWKTRGEDTTGLAGAISTMRREYTTKLGGYEKSRTFAKFISDDGDELVGTAKYLGLRKINTTKLIDKVEKKAAKQTEILQKMQQRLARPELTPSIEVWKSYLSELRKNISTNKASSIIKETLDEPTQKEFGAVIQSLLNQNDLEMTKLAKELESQIMLSQGKEFLYKPISAVTKASREAKIVDLQRKIVDVQNKTNKMISKLGGTNYIDKEGKLYRATQAATSEINAALEKTFFEENPAVYTAYRGLAHAKGVTGAEFFNGIKKFATNNIGDVAVKAPELKELKFTPEIARAIDNYYQSIKPDEIKTALKLYDDIQNWWKAQALLGPSYHSRNFVTAVWNNFLAGVKNPQEYVESALLLMGKKAKILDKEGNILSGEKIIEALKKTGTMGKGWYAADIPTAVEGAIGKVNWNPLSKNFVGFELNKKMGTFIENWVRSTLFVHELKEGKSIYNAAMTTKKFQFDYANLTVFEKTWMKRLFPFYSFYRFNIPLQLENLIKQPGKYAGLEKIVRSIEKISMGYSQPANEKYLSDYIKNNTAMRVGYNDKEKTYYYFLLGQWLPSYQAMDFFEQPLPNLMQLLTPFLKTPMEMMTNQSRFFRNTLGEYQTIENYPGESVNYLGFNMPKKTATVLRNIRLLNEIDKLNPGLIFGGKTGERSIWAKLKMPAVEIPKIGLITPALEKYRKTEPAPTPTARTATLFLGKLQAYKENFARNLYQADTERRIDEIKRSIKAAGRKGDTARVKALNEQLKEFVKERQK